MKKYSVMARVGAADRTSTKVVTFKALSVADALVRFERYHQSDMTFDDVEVAAVWQCSTCTCRTQGGGR